MKIEIEGRADLRPVILAALDAGRFTVSMKTTPTPQGAHIEAETVFVDVLGVVPYAKPTAAPGKDGECFDYRDAIGKMTDFGARVVSGSEYEQMQAIRRAVSEFAEVCQLPPSDDAATHLRGLSEDIARGHVLVLHPDGYRSAIVGAEPPATFMDELTAANLDALMEGVQAFALATIGPNEDGFENLQRWTDWARQGLVTVRKAGPPEIPRSELRQFIETQIGDEDEQMRVYGNVLSFIDEAVAGAAQVKPLRVERATTVQGDPPPEFVDVSAREMPGLADADPLAEPYIANEPLTAEAAPAAYTEAERAAMLMRDDKPDSFERLVDDPAPALARKVKHRPPPAPIDDTDVF